MPLCQVSRCPPLPLWSRVVQSRDVSPNNFDGLAMSSSAFSVASPTLYGFPFPKIGVRNLHLKLYSLFSQERVKIQTSNSAGPSRVLSNKSPLKIWEKRERGRIQGLPKFFSLPPIISGMGKAVRTSNFVRTFIRSIGTEAD